jgi:hypothetical protein
LVNEPFPDAVRDRVNAAPTQEKLIDLVTYQLAPIIYDLFVLGPQPLREELKWLIDQALTLSTFEDWIVVIIKEILNILTGRIVFSVPADAPSRKSLMV